VEASLALAIATLATRLVVTEAGAPDWLRLLIVTVVGVAVYLPVCLWRVPDLRAELTRIRSDRSVQTAGAE
jgi:hypothetical protein